MYDGEVIEFICKVTLVPTRLIHNDNRVLTYRCGVRDEPELFLHRLNITNWNNDSFSITSGNAYSTK